jgi:Mn2+/Fe2+ NRAMP family transporter
VRWDTALAVALGGILTCAIVATSASVFPLGTEISGPAQMVEQLKPLLGQAAAPIFAIGLVAAGLTSAITAPLAAAYATAGVLGWREGASSWRFRAVWCAVIFVGTLFAAVGTRPVSAIVFAQAANGILLPIVAVFLIFVVNRPAIMGRYVNGPVANVLGVAAVVMISGLAGWKLWQLFD